MRLEAHRLIELKVVAVWLGRLLALDERGQVSWRELLRCKPHVSVLSHWIELEMLVMRYEALCALCMPLHRRGVELTHEMLRGRLLPRVGDKLGNILRLLLVKQSWRCHSSPVVSNLLQIIKMGGLVLLENTRRLAQGVVYVTVRANSVNLHAWL